jgi:hypothetical protein
MSKKQTPSNEVKIESLKSIYEHNYALIELADNKATAILTVNGIMLTVILAFVGLKDNFFTSANILDIFAIISLSAFLISCLTSLVFSIITISPLQKTGVTPPKHVFYYVNILEHNSVDNYHNGLNKVLDDFFLLERGFAEQIYSISIVNKRKYKFVKWCVWTLLSSFVFVAILLVLSLIPN